MKSFQQAAVVVLAVMSAVLTYMFVHTNQIAAIPKNEAEYRSALETCALLAGAVGAMGAFVAGRRHKALSK